MSDLLDVVACEACRIGGGAVDYKCADCCVRLLMGAGSMEMKSAYLRSMARFGGEKHVERIQAKYKAARQAKRAKTLTKKE